MAEEDNDRAAERSGRYPGVALSDALAAAEKLYKQERQSPVDNATAASKMGYKGLTGPGRVMIGALRQYGLIEKTKVGRFRLSKLAIEALHGTEAQKASALRVAALNPSLFSELAKTHLDGSEDNLRSYLITEKGFIDTGARNAARAFRDTMALANITASGYTQQQSGEAGANKLPNRAVSPGDYVQWESGGVLQFIEPRRITGLSEDGSYVFVEGSKTGLPMTEVSKADPPPTASPIPSLPPTGQSTTAGTAQQKIPAMNWVLSVPRGVRAQLIITGDVKPDDLKRLKAQIDFLVESFDDSSSTEGQ